MLLSAFLLLEDPVHQQIEAGGSTILLYSKKSLYLECGPSYVSDGTQGYEGELGLEKKKV